MDVPKFLGPWYEFARFFGFFPIYGLRKDYTPLETSRRVVGSVALSLLNVGLHLSFFCYLIPVNFTHFETKIGSRVEKLFYIVDSAAPVITILLNQLLFGHVQQLFGMLQEVEGLLKEIHVHLDYRATHLFARLLLFLVLGMHLCPFAIMPSVLGDAVYFMDVLPVASYLTYRQLSNLSFSNP